VYIPSFVVRKCLLDPETDSEFSVFRVALFNPAGGVIASGCPGNIRNLSPQLPPPGYVAAKEKGCPLFHQPCQQPMDLFLAQTFKIVLFSM
jgi:hypothetical protein